MLFAILDDFERMPVGVVFHRQRIDFIEPIVSEPLQVPPECSFLFEEEFHHCLPDHLNGIDVAFAAAALIRYGYEEMKQPKRTMPDPKVIGTITVNPIVQRFLGQLETMKLKRHYGSVRSSSHIISALARLRLAGRDALNIRLAEAS